jgi:hypothetical protein
MVDIVRQICSFAITCDEVQRHSDFGDAVDIVRTKIIDTFRLSLLPQVPAFVQSMIKSAKLDARSHDKKHRLGAAVCVSALFEIFPFDDYITQYRLVVDSLLVPGYRPSVRIGGRVINRLARITGPNRDSYLRQVIESNRLRFAKNEPPENRYTAAVIWTELAKVAPELFFCMGTGFVATVTQGLEAGDRQVSELLVDLIDSLFHSRSASIGFSFLTETRGLLLLSAMKNLLDVSTNDDIITNCELLNVLLKLKPDADHQMAEALILPACGRHLQSNTFQVSALAVKLIVLLQRARPTVPQDNTLELAWEALLRWIPVQPTLMRQLLSRFLMAFPAFVKGHSARLQQRIRDLQTLLPPDVFSLVAIDFVTAMVETLKQLPSVLGLLAEVPFLVTHSAVPIPFHLLLRILNRTQPKWHVVHTFFKNEMLHVIRQELIMDGCRSDKWLFALLGLLEIPVTQFRDAWELASLVMKLRTCSDVEVREHITAAALHLFKGFPERIPLGMVQNLINFALGDPKCSVRKQSLLEFTEMTYNYIVQPDLLPIFSRFIYDESPEVRKSALCVLKNLPVNAGPALRRALLSLLK